MKIYIVQENSPYGIEGDQDFTTSLEDAFKLISIRLANGSKVEDDSIEASIDEIFDYVKNYSWHQGGAYYYEGEWDVFVAWREENGTLGADEYQAYLEENQIELNLGNVLFEISTIDTDNLPTLNNVDMFEAMR